MKHTDKKKSVFLLFTAIFAVIVALCAVVAVVLFRLIPISVNPQLATLAQHTGTPAMAMVFSTSNAIDAQLSKLLQNSDLAEKENRSASRFFGGVATRGFVFADLHPEKSQEIFSTFNEILNNFSELGENGFFSEDEDTPPSFHKPIVSFLRQTWESGFLSLGGALQVELPWQDRALLALSPYFNKFFDVKTNTFQEIMLKNSPRFVQDFLTNHAVGFALQSTALQDNPKLHRSEMTFFIREPQTFLNSICAEKLNPWDFCGRFSFDRKEFRKNFKAFLWLLDEDLKLRLVVYWTLRENTFVFANEEQTLKNMIANDAEENPNNILTAVSASGYDALLPKRESQRLSRLSFLFDTVSLQNKGLTFAEQLKTESPFLSDFFSSPSGELWFAKIEDTINQMTQSSEKVAITIDTDGKVLYPEVRLYEPVNDLFTQDGQAIAPDLLNSVRVFMTKAISFGNYLLPRGLVPLPGPFLQRNGKWVIIRSEISVKSLSTYLKSPEPNIDPNAKTVPL